MFPSRSTPPFADCPPGLVRAIRPRAAIAIPARDEAARLPACLAALAAQRGTDPAAMAVVVLANNCS